MKNVKKRIISLLLVTLLLVTLCPAVFAESESTGYRQFSSIVTLGDSNAMGYGLAGYKGDPNYPKNRDIDSSAQYTDFSYLFGGIKGSFPQIVAETLGVDAKNCTCMNYPALRSKDMLYFLGGDVDMTGDISFENSYKADRFNHAAIDSWRDENGKMTSFVPSEKTMGKGYGVDVGDYFINKLKSGDENQLVVLYAGASDVYAGISDMLFAPAGQTSELIDENDVAGSIAKIVEVLKEGYENFKTYVPALLKRVKELNPDCTIALVGTFNPLRDLSVSDDIYLPIFNAMAAVSETMNRYYKYWANTTDNCVYVDIANVETGTLEKGITVSDALAAITDAESVEFSIQDIYHATPDGYCYIARQITDQFVKDSQSACGKIVVDMGSLEQVKSVKLDGKYTFYQFDSTTQKLTVPCWRLNAKTLTVTGEKNGQTVAYMYKLDWSICRGYTARQFYATNDSVMICMAKIQNTAWNLRNLFTKSIF